MAISIANEKKVIAIMIKMYCRKNHASKELCGTCDKLITFAFYKIDNCKFGLEKPKCNNCKVHCFGTTKRESIRKVMRYAGPRMTYKHPLLAIKHFIRK
jgi:hypothetical protein